MGSDSAPAAATQQSQGQGRGRRWSRPWVLAAASGLCMLAIAFTSHGALQREAGTPHWIWHPSPAAANEYPAETRYFRKVIRVKEPSTLAVDVTADNAFELFLDGKLVAEGNDWKLPQRVEAKLATGDHVLAARARNEAPGAAGFIVRGGVLPLGQGVPVHTDATWRSTDRVPDGDAWTRLDLDDGGWARAQDLGPIGSAPWGELERAAASPAERFRVPDGFSIETVAQPSVTGSVVAFTFDPEGRPCVSIEGGPIARLQDDDKDGRYDRRDPITPAMSNCQGLSFIRGFLYAVGQGPVGTGLYRLSDENHDGVFEKTELVRESEGGMGEHGPHAVAMGPDGRLYYNNGNHAHLKPPIDPASPVNIAYEGELLPHYNDSRGHAAGIMAPGGEIYRSDDDGKTWKRIVAGFRNQYDFAFNRAGEMFTFDSDMEWDVGLPWYRPVRVNHCPLGAELGWRNGSAKWPAYYVDSLPAILDVGRGSPTGVTFYQAGAFPPDYHDSYLICDWSQGRILAVRLEPTGASYRGTATELVSGQPLNCTDIEVGPDGAVYFTTGGRGTQGGLFRVSAKQAPARPATGLTAWDQAIAMDSPQASFTCRKIEALRQQDTRRWDKEILEIAWNPDKNRSARERVRALDLLCEFARWPGEAVLLDLAIDEMPEVRSRAVTLVAIYADSPDVLDRLVKSLADPDPFVRRHACESLMQRPGADIPVEELIPLLADPDRTIRFAARTAIEHADLARHRDRLLAIETPRPQIEAMLALVRATKLDQAAQDDLLRRETGLLEKTTDAVVATDLLRLIELTYLLGPRKAEAPASAAIRTLLLQRFSTTADSPANREITRLLAFLNEPRAVAAILAHQATVADRPAQIHDAYCLRALKQGWTAASKRQLWAWYETASHWEGGFSFLGYLDYMIQELLTQLDTGERDALLASGEKFPFPTRVLVRELELERDRSQLPTLVALYQKLLNTPAAGAQADDLRSLILEKLGRAAFPQAHAALRELGSLDPPHRDQLARALADHPSDGDLPIFVEALGSRDPNTTSLVLDALQKLKAAPQGPDGLARLLALAKRAGPPSRQVLDDLGSRWTKTAPPPASASFEAALAAWEKIYHEKFPKGPALAEPAAPGAHSYDLAQLTENVLRGPVMQTADPKRGEQVILKARCLDCHKFGDKGAGLGPDLTTVNSRFRPSEILESIVLPSRVVSDQYRSVSLATQDGKVHQGMPIVADGPNVVLLLSDGTKVTIPRAEVEEQKASTTSVMPEGLLNVLSYQEIADLLSLFNSMPRVAAPATGSAKGQ